MKTNSGSPSTIRPGAARASSNGKAELERVDHEVDVSPHAGVARQLGGQRLDRAEHVRHGLARVVDRVATLDLERGGHDGATVV